MTKHEFPPFNMIIENGRLVPATPYDAERLDSFRRGTKVRVRFTEEKDRILVRKWWAILGLVIKQCDTPWKTKEEASEAVKLALGIVNLSKTVGGEYMAYPKSLTDLEDPELQDAVDNMTELLSRLTGVDVETLKKETANIRPEPDEPHDPETGELVETSASPQGEADDAGKVVAATSPVEPAAENVSAAAGSVEPDMFGKFNFAAGELQHLKDFARKGLDDASGSNDAPAKEAAIELLRMSYRDVIESDDGREAMAAICKTFPYMIYDGRPREKAAAYVAREILDCDASELEGRK